MIPLLILTLLLFTIYQVTKPIPHKNNSQSVVLTGICVNCNPEGIIVELTRSGNCAYCESNSIIKRESKKLVLTEAERFRSKLRRVK